MRIVVRAGLTLFLLSGLQVGSSRSAAPEYRPREIPAGPKAYTWRNSEAAVVKHCRRTLGEAYQKVGQKNAAWDQAAARYLEGFALFNAGKAGAPTSAALVADGKALLARQLAGCGDPLILYLHGSALQCSDNWAESEEFLKRALAGFEQSAYPKCHSASAAIRLGRLYQRMGKEKSKELDRYRDLAIKLLTESARDGSYAKGEQRIFLRLVRDDWEGVFKGKWDALYEALKKTPAVDPYIVKVIGGRSHVSQGWEARGGGWASEVTAKGWAGFEKHLRQARGLLTQAWMLHPEYPEAPTAMIGIAMAGHAGEGETERLWFDRAVAAQMDYKPAYENYFWSLRPRWGGSHEEMYDFGVECVNTMRFDTLVPWEFFDAVHEITEDLNGDKRYWMQPGTYERIRLFFEGYEERTKGASHKKYQSQHAAAAWYCEQWDEAGRLLDALGDGADPVAFTGWFYAPSLEYARSQVHAFTGPLASKVRQAEDLYKEQRLSDALAQYEKIPCDQDPVATPYLAGRVALLRLEEKFSKGEWVPLAPDPSFTGWRRWGDWVIEQDGSLKGTRTDHGLWLKCDADFGNRLEMRGQVEFLALPSDAKANFCIALACSPVRNEDEILFIAYRNGQKVAVSHAFYEKETFTRPAEVKDSNSFHVQVWDELVNAYFNGKLVHRAVTIDRYGLPANPTVAFGAAYDVGAVLRFRNVEVRRLTAMPAPVASEQPRSSRPGGAAPARK